MLLWQQSSARNKRYWIFSQLIIVSALLHIFCMLILFFWYRQNATHLSITVDHSLMNSDDFIIVVPTLNTHLLANNAVSNKEKTINQAHTTKTAAPLTQLMTPKVVDAPVKDHQENKVVAKKQQSQKQLATPVKAEKKEPVDRAIQPTEKKDSGEPQAAVAAESVVAPVSAVVDRSTHELKENYHTVYATPEQVEQYRKQELLRNLVLSEWAPPVGVDKKCFCQITFTVNWQKGLEKVQFDSSSGVLIYDIAARSALFAVKMPDWARGKTFTIAFR